VTSPETPHDWIGKRVEVELIRPGGAGLRSEHRWGTLEAVNNLGITGAFSSQTGTPAKTRRRFYPWSAVLSMDLSR
jgi:hypothetical protein